MARRPGERFPSDDARRKGKPAFRVHLSVASHRRTAAVWAVPEQRGMLVELWRLARERFAARTNNTVILSPGDIASITGRSRRDIALMSLRSLCDRLEYPLERHGDLVAITIRNFGRKQGFDPADGGDTPRDPVGPHLPPNPSPNPSPNLKDSPPTSPPPNGHSESGSHEPPGGEEPEAPEPAITVQRVLELAEERQIPILNGEAITPERFQGAVRSIEARIREHPREGQWIYAFDQVEKQPFLRRESTHFSLAFMCESADNWGKVVRRHYEPDKLTGPLGARR